MPKVVEPALDVFDSLQRLGCRLLNDAPVKNSRDRCFFESLFADPLDYEALNGLGSILYFEREFEAAEFFIRRALVLAKRAGVDYPAAKSDLDLVLRARRGH